MIDIRPADFEDPRLIAMLALHARRARAETGRDSAHVLDLDGLRVADVRLWTGWEDDTLLSVGALKRLDATQGEIKSMYTAEAARRRGAGRAILAHLIATARAQGMARLYLETGSWPYFETARTFYRAHGFAECAPFGDYRPDPNSVFMTMAL